MAENEPVCILCFSSDEELMDNCVICKSKSHIKCWDTYTKYTEHTKCPQCRIISPTDLTLIRKEKQITITDKLTLDQIYVFKRRVLKFLDEFDKNRRNTKLAIDIVEKFCIELYNNENLLYCLHMYDSALDSSQFLITFYNRIMSLLRHVDEYDVKRTFLKPFCVVIVK